jgi:rhamnosyltransferase
MSVSTIIRTYNEEKHLRELLDAIRSQDTAGGDIEVVVVDSGSTDSTLKIAESFSCRTVHISKEEFTFGRSLNVGCEAASYDFLVFVSGHCIPTNRNWLESLIAPLKDGVADYSYGRQIGNGDSKFSECQLFKKYYPETSQIPQEGFFINNANSAIKRSAWKRYRFNEELTGLEDMDLGKRITMNGGKLAYVADAEVYHIHDESWHKVKTRYEREAIALQKIMPEVHVQFPDFLRYLFSSIFFDLGSAIQEKRLIRTTPSIVMYRLMQYWGSYKGNHMHRKLSRTMKENYFYPK